MTSLSTVAFEGSQIYVITDYRTHNNNNNNNNIKDDGERV